MRTNGDAPRQTKNRKLPQNNSRLFTAVQQRASLNEDKAREFADIRHVGQVASLPYDLIFRILLLLPAESLLISSSVCKEWFSLINSSDFIEAHSQQCESVFIFLKKASPRLKSFKIEDKLGLLVNSSIFSKSEPLRSYINFVKVQGGRCKVIESNISGFKNILATCNGLILATCEQNGGLLVLNPMTRKLSALPLGTTLPLEQSYGFVFSQLTKQYKVVHLFQDESLHISCEILSLNTRLWRGVDGPSFGLFTSLVHKPVTAIGALHWLPSSANCSFIVSMGIDDEKFRTLSLPISSTPNDRLVEIGGFLSFVTHVGFRRLDVWMLKGLWGEGWVKQHIITSYRVPDLVPVSALRCGRELIFQVNGAPCFYAYDVEKEEMRVAVMEGGAPGGRQHYLPHVNTLTR
ncbi:hypothetical protein RHMOL_Rhmol02G0255500 [Rhododendron molle]|uniref:Uncharacterized protein n=1 Tax=Rhododendron molle TaxID=49168 RepID=A0ACC0PVF4_RHOML|nr:hypothetical protein RHMOL_Rhmol02G0255500 [Rhododendron molle]